MNAELFLIYKGNGVNQAGNPAAVSSEYWDLGQWLCVPLFRVVCLYLTYISDICGENLNKKITRLAEVQLIGIRR